MPDPDHALRVAANEAARRLVQRFDGPMLKSKDRETDSSALVTERLELCFKTLMKSRKFVASLPRLQCALVALCHAYPR